MNIAICEDEQAQAAEINKLVKEWASENNIGIAIHQFASAEAFLFHWPETSFDLAVLDIQMKEMSGFELAKRIRRDDSTMSIVFLTSLMQFVFRGYDVDALHYLTKPINRVKLISVLGRAHKLWLSKKNEALTVSKDDGDYSIPLLSITYFSMTSHYAEVYADTGVYKLRKTADTLERELPSFFIRCHRSIIVNMHRVEYIMNESVGVTGGEALPISRNRKKAISAAFMNLHKEG